MPELPEVETVKNALAGLLLNQTIEDVFVFREKNIKPSLKEFLSIKGERVSSLSRKGKYLIFHLTNDKVLIGHLRMEGKFFFRENEEFDKFDLIVFKLSNGFYLCYNDVRKFGGLSLYRDLYRPAYSVNLPTLSITSYTLSRAFWPLGRWKLATLASRKRWR